jgi:hypothetical protein
MSDTHMTPVPVPHPPRLPATAGSPATPSPLGDDPNDCEPVSSFAGVLDALLRHPRRVMYRLREPASGWLIGAMLAIAVICSLVYGLIVGTFAGGVQLWAAPLKIAAGLFISALICLPSLYIFSCLGGSRARLVEVVGLVAGLLVLMTVLLIGFAPVAWVFSQSTDSLAAMGGLHLVFGAIATYFGLRFLRDGLMHLSGKPDGLRIWVIVFLLVMLQMTTALRPIVGTAEHVLPREKKFFPRHWIEQIEKPAPPVKPRP